MDGIFNKISAIYNILYPNQSLKKNIKFINTYW